ncbi:hypothetical protein N7532_000639 [Penicillium argentinense]|uniref:Zn(2)-C6 fungal-type domain-containing protein n=1 Tax=Penicillium argentinense TaxID=1131581 RepID=A0A9W9G5Y5_9EURO|nr:uncharacterized protein N7532_000639 [Penicillium argentinense]KAJ5112594.1 hypothetical protein N7532_000639 [Penicillium argentinense]
MATNGQLCCQRHDVFGIQEDTTRSKLRALPNELLVEILTHLPIDTLVRTATVSQRFRDAVEHALKPQLVAISRRTDIKLMLLCASPDSVQLRVRCKYLRTSGLSIDTDDMIRSGTTIMHTIYRPEALAPESMPVEPTIGSIIMLVGGDDVVRASMNETAHKGFATRRAILEDYESFVQLRVKLNLVIAAKELFIAPAFIIHDGMIRLDREMLENNREELVWMTSDKSVGLRIQAFEKAVEDDAKQFDLEIQAITPLLPSKSPPASSPFYLVNYIALDCDSLADLRFSNVAFTANPGHVVAMESLRNGSIAIANTPTPVRRTRVACKACNARRVKCDAGDGQPCWHCRMRQIPCKLIDSKRGKYTRKGRDSDRDQHAPRKSRRNNASANEQGSPRNNSHNSQQTASVSPSGGVLRQDPIQSHSNETERLGLGSSQDQTRQLISVPQNSDSGGLQHTRPESRTDDLATLHYVIELSHRPAGGSTEPLTVHHPIPESIADKPGLESSQLEAPVSLQEALTLPEPDILHRLIYTFFEKIHPAYPVFDRENLTRSYSLGQASPLVLQTICLLGLTIGGDDLIRASGFTDRATARKTHFLRAKALYDADYETDRMNLAAVLLLFGFWWAGPDDQKDTCHWVGCAITFAQSLGMHRSYDVTIVNKPSNEIFAETNMTRDKHTSAAFGRPCRIRDEDCDVEELTEEDFEFDIGYDQALIPAQEAYQVSYVLEMIQLAAILGDILIGEYSPRRPPLEKYESGALHHRLVKWESKVPKSLQIKSSEACTKGSFWGCMLQISFQAIKDVSPAEAESDSRARNAADLITRFAEDLLATGMIHSGLIHLVPALFSALSIHTIVICRKDSIQRQLAENKSRQCMLALSVIAKSWPVRIWISKAFVNLMKRLTGQGQNLNGPIVNVSSSILTTPYNGSSLKQTEQWNMASERSQNITNQAAPNMLEPSSHCTCNNGANSGGLHAQGCLWQAPDQFIHDSLWVGYLDNALDVDLSLHDGGGFTQYMSFEGTGLGGQSAVGDV